MLNGNHESLNVCGDFRYAWGFSSDECRPSCLICLDLLQLQTGIVGMGGRLGSLLYGTLALLLPRLVSSATAAMV